MVERSHKPAAISTNVTVPQPSVHTDADNTKVTASLPTGETVEVLLHGATVISWNSGGRENLWLSEKAVLDGSKPVRGGFPVVFPVFGPPPKNHATSSLPQHGFARNSKWQYLGNWKSSSESGPLKQGGDDTVKVDFGLDNGSISEESKKAWPYHFSLVYSVTLSPEGLKTNLTVENTGDKPFEFQMLLHSYFKVKDISTTSVNGLLGTSYIDKVLNASEHTESSNELRINGEVDRVYRDIKQNTTSIVEAGKPSLDVIRNNLADTVIWNPWKEKAAAMGDFAPNDGYKNMVCVESGAVNGWQKLEPMGTWEGGQTVKALLSRQDDRAY